MKRDGNQSNSEDGNLNNSGNAGGGNNNGGNNNSGGGGGGGGGGRGGGGPNKRFRGNDETIRLLIPSRVCYKCYIYLQ